VALKDGHRVVGVFGQVTSVEEPDENPVAAELTPRQAEILRLLEGGKSTGQIAAELQLSQETVRNHIRRLFRALDVHTRLEAVARARVVPPLERTSALR
jgi:DNA-binding NarL/FixJ family response regulator